MIRPRFTGAWNGIYRFIPVEYRTPQGFNYTLRLDVRSITDEAGQPLRYESSRERHYRKFKIWVPGAVNATRTVLVRYRVRNGLKFFDEHDELYWNVTGDESEVPIEAASARVILPDGVSGVRAAAFTGGYGSRETAAMVDAGSTEVAVRTERPLSFREGLTVVVGWNPGVVSRPTPVDRTVSFMSSNIMLAVPIMVFPVMGWLWHMRGRDPRRKPIATCYEPPESLSPAEAGTLIDNSPDLRDVTATIVDLAVRGYVHIAEREEKQLLGLLTSTDYTFTLRKPRAEWTTLNVHERELLEHMFGAKDAVELSDLKNEFYKHLPDLRSQIFRQLIGHGCYVRRPDRIRKAFLLAGAAAAVVVTVIGTVLSEVQGLSGAAAVIAGISTGLIVIGFGWFMPSRTERGTRVLENTLGFEEFLRRVEKDRLERLVKTPELFEKYLPYAMAFGVEDKWARAFEDIYTKAPEWYEGPGRYGFRPRSFVSDLGQMSTRAAAVMTSAPRSSGGSGFSSGGGFSGGGFGGGGTGGF